MQAKPIPLLGVMYHNRRQRSKGILHEGQRRAPTRPSRKGFKGSTYGQYAETKRGRLGKQAKSSLTADIDYVHFPVNSFQQTRNHSSRA